MEDIGLDASLRSYRWPLARIVLPFGKFYLGSLVFGGCDFVGGGCKNSCVFTLRGLLAEGFACTSCMCCIHNKGVAAVLERRVWHPASSSTLSVCHSIFGIYLLLKKGEVL